MNIYDIFLETSPRTPVSYKQLIAIKQKHCPDVSQYLLEHHRRIYHLQQHARNCWKPENRKAPETDRGNFITYDGRILDTKCKEPGNAYYGKTVSTAYNETRIKGVKLKLLHRDNPRWTMYVNLQDHRFNIIFINEHTIPKYEPRSKTICSDVRTPQFEQVERKLRGNHLVLRCTLIENNQYDLWTLSLKNLKLKRQVATIDGDVIGLGKTKRGSELSKTIKVGHKITAALS